MGIIIKSIIIVIFLILCLCCISQGINKNLVEEIDRQKKLNKQILELYQNEKDKTDTLYRIIFHIRQELSLLRLKNCPEEEFKNIPFEIIEWIDMLEKVNKGDEDGIHK